MYTVVNPLKGIHSVSYLLCRGSLRAPLTTRFFTSYYQSSMYFQTLSTSFSKEAGF